MGRVPDSLSDVSRIDERCRRHCNALRNRFVNEASLYCFLVLTATDGPTYLSSSFKYDSSFKSHLIILTALSTIIYHDLHLFLS